MTQFLTFLKSRHPLELFFVICEAYLIGGGMLFIAYGFFVGIKAILFQLYLIAPLPIYCSLVIMKYGWARPAKWTIWKWSLIPSAMLYLWILYMCIFHGDNYFGESLLSKVVLAAFTWLLACPFIFIFQIRLGKRINKNGTFEKL
ncbi:MAG: hypothetical protein CMF62_08690 [Magnetococcales bacterium]|nr:hypothetical protein [Magnetococcales bacterium]